MALNSLVHEKCPLQGFFSQVNGKKNHSCLRWDPSSLWIWTHCQCKFIGMTKGPGRKQGTQCPPPIMTCREVRWLRCNGRPFMCPSLRRPNFTAQLNASLYDPYLPLPLTCRNKPSLVSISLWGEAYCVSHGWQKGQLHIREDSACFSSTRTMTTKVSVEMSERHLYLKAKRRSWIKVYISRINKRQQAKWDCSFRLTFFYLLLLLSGVPFLFVFFSLPTLIAIFAISSIPFVWFMIVYLGQEAGPFCVAFIYVIPFLILQVSLLFLQLGFIDI